MKLYYRLKDRYDKEKYQPRNLLEEAAKINSLRELDPEQSKHTYEIIYALIFHHYRRDRKGTSFCQIPYHGVKVSRSGGVTFNFIELPPVLQQILCMFVDECYGYEPDANDSK